MNDIVTQNINIFPNCESISSILGTMILVLACMVNHHKVIDEIIPRNGVLTCSPFFRSSVISDLEPYLKFKLHDGDNFGRNNSYLSKFTGIPAHKIVLSHMENVKDLVPQMSSEFQDEL